MLTSSKSFALCSLFALALSACASPPPPAAPQCPACEEAPVAAKAAEEAPKASPPVAKAAVVTDDYRTSAEHGLMEGFPPEEAKRVTRWNGLMGAPYNRWAYLNMRTLYPTAGIEAADKATKIKHGRDADFSKLQIEKPDDKGFASGSKVDFDTFLKETFTDSLVVVSGDRVVYEKYLNGMNSTHPHQMMSVTKSFAGLFGLMAVSDGKAKEEERIGKLIPELEASGAFKDASFGQVLDMTNSMDFTENYADPESGIVHYGVVLGLMKPAPGREYAHSIYEYLPTLGFDAKHKHGEVFHYQTPKTDVVNWVTNRLTGKSFQDNLHQVLWSKLGTEGETYVLLDKNGTLFAGGGLNATPDNLTRFATMMLNGGKHAGKQVVAPEVIEKLSAGGSVEAFAHGPNATGFMNGGDWSYRAQWWVRHTKGRAAFTAIGIHGQWIYVDIGNKVAIVKQSSQPTSATDYQASYDLYAFDAIIDHLKSK